MKSKFTNEEKQKSTGKLHIKVRIPCKHYKVRWNFKKHLLQMAIGLSTRTS